jgi:hypothetical protein
MPAAARPHCILHARDLVMLAFAFGRAVGGVIIAKLYKLSRLNLACAGPGGNGPVVKLCSPYPRLFFFGITENARSGFLCFFNLYDKN